MNFNNYVEKEERILPVYLLVDTSGSMRGEKIETVNVAVREMLTAFRKIENPKGQINLSILTFGKDGVNVVKDLSPIKEDERYEFFADGMTPMGESFIKLKEEIGKLPFRAYAPSIILVSDGNPTDYDDYSSDLTVEEIMNWPALKELHYDERGSEAVKVAMGIGDDVDSNILHAFINDKNIPLIKAYEIDTITKFFKWVSNSVSVRSLSINPNQVKVASPDMFDRNEVDFQQ